MNVHPQSVTNIKNSHISSKNSYELLNKIELITNLFIIFFWFLICVLYIPTLCFNSRLENSQYNSFAIHVITRLYHKKTSNPI